jgi:hypothetical protein
MAQPISIQNSTNQKIDPIVDIATGDVKLKGSVGTRTGVGSLSDDVGWQAVATHETGADTWEANDPAAVLAGVYDGTDVLPMLVDALGRLLVVTKGSSGNLTDYSGTAGVADATVVAANPDRQYLFFQNVSNVDLWINFNVAAALDSPSIKVPPDGSMVWEGNFVPTQALHVISGTATKKYTCKEG